MIGDGFKAGVAQAGALGWGGLAATSTALSQSAALVILFAVLAVITQLVALGLVTSSKPRSAGRNAS